MTFLLKDSACWEAAFIESSTNARLRSDAAVTLEGTSSDPKSIDGSDGMDGSVNVGSLGSSTFGISTFGISTFGTSNGNADTVDEAAFAAEEATFDAVDFALEAIVVGADVVFDAVAVVFWLALLVLALLVLALLVVFLATFFFGVVVLVVAFFGVVFSVMMRPCSRERPVLQPVRCCVISQRRSSPLGMRRRSAATWCAAAP